MRHHDTRSIRHVRLSTVLALSAAILGATCGANALAQSASPARPRIEKAADLPRFTYPVKGKLDELVRSTEAFAPLAAALRRDTESVLAGYDIPDKGTRRDLLNLLAQLDFLEGHYDRAVERLAEVRSLEEKPADKLLSGMRLTAMARAAKASPQGSDAYGQAVETSINEVLQPLPYAVVENDVKSYKARAEIVGENLILGQVREVLQPMADTTGVLSHEFAASLVNARLGLVGALPLKARLIKVYGDYLVAHQVMKADIWAERDFTLLGAGRFTPVKLGIWDGGVDSTLFPKQRVVSAQGQTALLAFDTYSRPTKGELLPLSSGVRAHLSESLGHVKGYSDLQSNIDSPEASAVKQRMSNVAAADYKRVIEEFNLIGNYMHGTHVAGIALAGNPHARLAVARIGFDHHLKPDPCPSKALALRDARNNRAWVAFFKREGVKVVNMSWGGSVQDVESALEQCGIGASPEQRKLAARELFDITKSGLVAAMKSAPGILFVAAAGNSNSDSSFTENMPADIELPNVVTVGAVDSAGDEAPFTSYGKTVRLHANGYQVESYLPGGMRVRLSGTSMAAPQVTNLAGKLLAIRPTLTPTQLIDVMVKTADRSDDGRRVLINPAKAVEVVQARQR